MSKKPYPSETADRFIVRLPEGMRDRIRDSADANGRSMNAEIIRRLEVTFDMEETEKTLPYRFSELDEKIDKLDRLLAMTLDAISSPESEADVAFAVEEFERRMRDNLAAHKKIVKRQRKT